jgi:hypothetical protein
LVRCAFLNGDTTNGETTNGETAELCCQVRVTDQLAASEPTTPLVVLKDEPATTVARIGTGTAAIVKKTYRPLGLRWLQSLWRPSRAEREFRRLRAIGDAGVPCLEALRWSAVKHFGGYSSSTLVTRFLPDSVPLKQILQGLDRQRDHRTRAALASAMGRLVGALHTAGFLWCTPMPRNALVVGDPAAAHLVICDTPSSLAIGRPLRGARLARIDLFLAAFSPSRHLDWSTTERWRWLLGYCRGDANEARALWHQMQRREPLWNELAKAMAMIRWTYLAGWLRGRR